MRIAHVISEYSRHEAMGRTIAETARRVDAEHFLVATRVHDGAEEFAGTHEVGGELTTFAFRRGDRLAAALDEIRPDIVHVHGGALAPVWVRAKALRGRRMVMTVYGWPRVPGPRSLRRASFTQLTRSNVLRPRVLVSTLLPAAAARALLRHSSVEHVLSPDPDARQRLDGCGVPVRDLPSGASLNDLRAAYSTNAPTVLFAGRAEMVRGVDTLLVAFPAVLRAVPDARLRLLLIPTPELPDVLAAVEASGLGEACTVQTEPVAALDDELAAAQIGAWPFKFDYTTSPPAMALAEAMAVGLPVVATNVTCVRSIATDGVNASLTDPGDAAALARSIIDLLSDCALWQQHAAAGLHTIAHEASWDSAAARTAEAYGTATLAVVTA